MSHSAEPIPRTETAPENVELMRNIRNIRKPIQEIADYAELAACYEAFYLNERECSGIETTPTQAIVIGLAAHVAGKFVMDNHQSLTSKALAERLSHMGFSEWLAVPLARFVTELESNRVIALP